MQSGTTPAAQDKFADVGQGPNSDDLSYQIQQLVDQGVITPEDAQAALAGPSAMNNVTTDPKLAAAQKAALSSLQEISDNGGMTTADKSNLNQIAVDEATKDKGQRDAIIQGAASRGVGGSGLDLAAQLQNEQATASDKSNRDLAVAGTAQQRALDALMNEGNLASTVQSNEFNQGAQKASANDAISKFNAQNLNQMTLANKQATDNAASLNLQNKQNIANTNASLQTAQNKQKADVAQQIYNNKLAKAGGSQSVSNQNASAAGANSNAAANASNQTIGTGITAGALLLSDEREKEDVEKFDPSDFLDKITGYSFRYKDPKKNGAGKRMGPMAQDLEKSDVGASMVHNTPEGKKVDTGAAALAALSSLASVHERLKKIEGGKK